MKFIALILIIAGVILVARVLTGPRQMSGLILLAAFVGAVLIVLGVVMLADPVTIVPWD